jgi:hydrogenase expression/formation protein HypE
MDKITLGHGSGGSLMHDLIKDLFLKKLGNPVLTQLMDSALLNYKGRKFVFTTDSFVVKPIFFPGSDIGRLAVFGTVNDLAVMAARPRFLSCAMVIEEGFDYTSLVRITDSIARACRRSGVQIVTGDLKVVEKGSADSLFINTAGIGELLVKKPLSVSAIRPGDKIILSGTIADHGIAVLSARKGFGFEGSLRSDCASLVQLVQEILKAARGGVKFMRDPTRGGLATTLNEIAQATKLGIVIEETEIPVRKEVAAACDILGLDPLYVANEGKLVLILKKELAQKVVGAMRKHRQGKHARIIGQVTCDAKGKVILKTTVGGSRILDMLYQDQLPRIC